MLLYWFLIQFNRVLFLTALHHESEENVRLYLCQILNDFQNVVADCLSIIPVKNFENRSISGENMDRILVP